MLPHEKEMKKDHRSWVWSILAQCQNTWLWLLPALQPRCATNDVRLLILIIFATGREKKAVFCDDCVLLVNCLILIFLLFHGRAAAHLLIGCDSNYIPAASRACVLTCLSTTLAWSRSPATPGTKTGPVGETRRISLYSKARGFGTFPICPFYILYSALAHNGWVGLQLECRALRMHFRLLLIVWV